MPVTRQQSKGKLKPMHGEPITDAKSEGGSTGDRPNYCEITPKVKVRTSLTRGLVSKAKKPIECRPKLKSKNKKAPVVAAQLHKYPYEDEVTPQKISKTSTAAPSRMGSFIGSTPVTSAAKHATPARPGIRSSASSTRTIGQLPAGKLKATPLRLVKSKDSYIPVKTVPRSCRTLQSVDPNKVTGNRNKENNINKIANYPKTKEEILLSHRNSSVINNKPNNDFIDTNTNPVNIRSTRTSEVQTDALPIPIIKTKCDFDECHSDKEKLNKDLVSLQRINNRNIEALLTVIKVTEHQYCEKIESIVKDMEIKYRIIRDKLMEKDQLLKNNIINLELQNNQINNYKIEINSIKEKLEEKTPEFMQNEVNSLNDVLKMRNEQIQKLTIKNNILEIKALDLEKDCDIQKKRMENSDELLFQKDIVYRKINDDYDNSNKKCADLESEMRKLTTSMELLKFQFSSCKCSIGSPFRRMLSHENKRIKSNESL